MKSYSKEQILEAGRTLVNIAEDVNDDGGDYAETVHYVVSDIIDILEGKLELPPNPKTIEEILGEVVPPPNAVAREQIILPGVGFVPVLGQIKDRRIEWFTDEDGD